MVHIFILKHLSLKVTKDGEETKNVLKQVFNNTRTIMSICSAAKHEHEISFTWMLFKRLKKTTIRKLSIEINSDTYF